MNNLILILASNHESSIERVIQGLPPSVLADPDSEILVVDDDSQDQTFFVSDEVVHRLTRGAQVRVLRNPVAHGAGASQKLGFKYAIERGFQRVFVIHGNAERAAEVLDRLLSEYQAGSGPDAVFASRIGRAMPLIKRAVSWFLTSARNRILGCRLLETESRFQSFSTSFLKKIPFERNSDDMGFHAEIVVQAVAAGAKLVQIPLATTSSNGFRGSSGARYAWRSLIACFHYRLQGMGFLYDPKFDVGEIPYVLKESPLSSHSLLVAKVAAPATVLDIGCGEGYLADQLTARGCTVDGVDFLPKENIRGKIRHYQRIDLNRHPDELGEWLARSRYDVLLLGDVIEHLIDPEGFLDIIRARVSPTAQTRLLVSTGNVAFLVVRWMLWLGQFNYGPRGILDRTHRRLFTIGSFRRLFDQCGYRIHSVSAVPMPFSAVLSSSPRLARTLERANAGLAKVWPGLFAYQMIVEAEPLPTAAQLLSLSESRAEASRKIDKDGASAGANPLSPS